MDDLSGLMWSGTGQQPKGNQHTPMNQMGGSHPQQQQQHQQQQQQGGRPPMGSGYNPNYSFMSASKSSFSRHFSSFFFLPVRDSWRLLDVFLTMLGSIRGGKDDERRRRRIMTFPCHVGYWITRGEIIS